MKLELKQLSECPECLTTVGTWIYEQWWKVRHNSPEVVFSLLRTHTQKDQVPFTVIAFADGVPAGSCCVIENDCFHRPQYTPWVAAVFVKPGLRRRGIASSLLQEAAMIAARSGVEGLYIDCLATTAPVYEKNGWVIHEREVGDKESVVMLRKTKVQMLIRPFQAEDEPAVISLWRRCDLVRAWNDPVKDIQRKLKVRPDLFLVGVLKGQLIACVMAGYEGHRGWLNYLAVAPEHQRHGYARAIVAEAERRLREAGCPKINLQVRSSNRGVIEFYQRLGYSVDDVVSMGKRLEHDDERSSGEAGEAGAR